MTYIQQIDYQKYRCTKINSRIFSYRLVEELITENHANNAKVLGKTHLGREIKLVKIGTGLIKVMLWSQMHGDEPTATAAIFDILNFFKESDEHNNFKESLLERCTFYFIPVVNPDGLVNFTRRNAQNIDINRDYLAEQTPEGRILKAFRAQIKPHFGFNLHDQSTLYHPENSQEPTCIAFLAPAFDKSKTVNNTREKAIGLINQMSLFLQQIIPDKIARFDDEFEPRAFGDNFQKEGTSTILIESGGYKDDSEKQYIRELNFKLILVAIESIANNHFLYHDLDQYFNLPENNKKIFHILLQSVPYENTIIDIGINYLEEFNTHMQLFNKQWIIEDIGDLTNYTAYNIYKLNNCIIKGAIKLGNIGDLVFVKDGECILNFIKGKKM